MEKLRREMADGIPPRMNSRQARGRGGRSASGRTLLFLVLLPGLLFGPAFGGMAAWLHSHGPAGEHLHFVTEQVGLDHLGTLHDWHDAQHRHEREDGSDQDDVPAPTGLLVDLPHILAAPVGSTTLVSALSVHLPAVLPAPRWHLALVKGTHRHELYCSGWPPQRAKRSGVAELLRCSHAILI